jgi:hypothetical protein
MEFVSKVALKSILNKSQGKTSVKAIILRVGWVKE